MLIQFMYFDAILAQVLYRNLRIVNDSKDPCPRRAENIFSTVPSTTDICLVHRSGNFALTLSFEFATGNLIKIFPNSRLSAVAVATAGEPLRTSR